jgi:hypothetical protein
MPASPAPRASAPLGQGARAVIATTGNQSWVGRKPADFPRFETHFLAVEPQQLFIAVVFEAGADLLHAKGLVDVGGRNIAQEHCARQFADIADHGSRVLLGGKGGGLTGALGHLGCSGFELVIANINHCL